MTDSTVRWVRKGEKCWCRFRCAHLHAYFFCGCGKRLLLTTPDESTILDVEGRTWFCEWCAKEVTS